jgi:transcription antitermination factor NusG
VRFCDSCHKTVHYCDNVEQASIRPAGVTASRCPVGAASQDDLAEGREYLVMGELALPRRPARRPEAGGRIRIRDGAFASKEGVIESVNARRRSVRLAAAVRPRLCRLKSSGICRCRFRTVRGS